MLASAALSPVCKADYITNLLGSGGPGQFALLAFGGTGTDALNINAATVEGSGNGTVIGVQSSSGSSQLELSNPDTLTGMTEDLGYQVTTSGTAGHPAGAVNTSSSATSPVNIALNSAVTSLTNAWTYMSGTLANSPNYTYSWSDLPSTLAAANVGVINVLNITGNGGSIPNLTLDDSNGSQWIVNILGTNVNITTGNIKTSSGSAYDVVFNVVNAGSTFDVQVPTAGWEGILIAPDSTVTIDGNWDGEVAGGGDGTTMTLMSNITLDHTAGAEQFATPEPSSLVLLAGGLSLLALRLRRPIGS